MNIISNSCVGAFITSKVLKEKLNNPFTWALIDCTSMYNLISKWNELNFENYELKRYDNWKFSIIIDNLVEIKYIHYKFDKNAKTPIKKDIDIYYNRIWEYIVEKYKTRLKRMKELNEEPIFILGNGWTTKETTLSIDFIKKLNDLKKNNIIVVVDKIIDNIPYCKQITNINDMNKVGANHRLAIKIYNEFFK